MKKKYEVPITYKGTVNYIVEAENAQEAEIEATIRWGRCDIGDSPCTDDEEIIKVGKIIEFGK